VHPLQPEQKDWQGLLIPANSPDRRPTVVALPRRADYLNVIAERLGGNRPLALHARHRGQATEQPVLYFLLSEDPVEPNTLASDLAGVEIYGDAILVDVELRVAADGVRYELRCGSIARCERELARHKGGLVGILLATVGRPLLGCWALPRRTAWPVKQAPPHGVLSEWLLKQPLRSDGAALFACAEVSVVHVDSDGNPMPQASFLGTVRTNAWTEGLPEGGVLLDDGTIEVNGVQCSSKKEAERDAMLALMHIFKGHELTPEPSLELIDVGSDRQPADGALPNGSTVECSYKLQLLPLTAAGLAGGTLEEMSQEEVLLGGGLLHADVEALLAEVGQEWLRQKGESPKQSASAPASTTVQLQVRYHGVERCCELSLSVHEAELGEEEREYELVGDSTDGPPLGELRLRKVRMLLAELGATSVADIGCGDGKLLQQLIASQHSHLFQEPEQRGSSAKLTHLIGVDVSAKGLRRAASKLRSMWTQAMATGGAKLPSVKLLRCSLAKLELEPQVDVITLIEVVEHLDPPDLKALGSALLERCMPRVLIVSTPNKEYNLRWMLQCSRNRRCPRDNCTTPEDVEAMCSNCRLYVSNCPPPINKYPLRNKDHRFEWTRREFREWAEHLAAEHGYAVFFDGVGGDEWEEKQRPEDRWYGLGPISQLAIFEQLEHDPPARLQQQPMVNAEVVWSSETEWSGDKVAN